MVNVNMYIEQILYYITCDNIEENDWIKELNFIIKKNNIFNYNASDFILFKNINEGGSNGFDIILSRFGINYDDMHKYTILFPEKCLKKSPNAFLESYYDIKISNNNKCFILINEYKKCIEIGFDVNGYVDINNCYIFDKDSKDSKYKLLLNLDKKKYPFLQIIPNSSPYLCYQKNGDFFLEFILSTKNSSSLYHQI